MAHKLMPVWQRRQATPGVDAYPPSPGQPLLRLARIGDGKALAALYRDVHTPSDGGCAKDHYPFPQYMDASWIDDQIAGGEVVWSIAEVGGEAVATGSVVRIGEAASRVFEFGGFVVRSHIRRCGIASRIVEDLSARFLGVAALMVAETRVAEAGALKTFFKAGLLPTGFSPFAHRMSRGLESMVPMVRIDRRFLQQRRIDGCCTPAVSRLAAEVLAPLNVMPLATAGLLASSAQRAIQYDPSIEVSLATTASPPGEHDGGISRGSGIRSCGILPLEHRQGEDATGWRYVARTVTLRARAMPCAAVALIYDRLDQRAHLRSLLARSPDVVGTALMAGIKAIKSIAGDAPFSVFTDVCADDLAVQQCLEAAGFFPTVYVPAYVAAGSQRRDLVEYTFLYRLRLSEMVPPAADGGPQPERLAGRIFATLQRCVGETAPIVAQ